MFLRDRLHKNGMEGEPEDIMPPFRTGFKGAVRKIQIYIVLNHNTNVMFGQILRNHAMCGMVCFCFDQSGKAGLRHFHTAALDYPRVAR